MTIHVLTAVYTLLLLVSDGRILIIIIILSPLNDNELKLCNKWLEVNRVERFRVSVKQAKEIILYGGLF